MLQGCKVTCCMYTLPYILSCALMPINMAHHSTKVWLVFVLWHTALLKLVQVQYYCIEVYWQLIQKNGLPVVSQHYRVREPFRKHIYIKKIIGIVAACSLIATLFFVSSLSFNLSDYILSTSLFSMYSTYALWPV